LSGKHARAAKIDSTPYAYADSSLPQYRTRAPWDIVAS